MEYNSALKRNEWPSYEKIWRILECILLRDTSWSKKTHAIWFQLHDIWHLGKDKAMEIVKRSVVAKSPGWKGDRPQIQRIFKTEKLLFIVLNYNDRHILL
jgi:hypothetical protein